MTSNRVLQKLAHEVVEQAQRAYARDGGKVTRFHSTRYQAGTWSQPRRVVIKVEVSAQGVNTRFVVTDLEQAELILQAALDPVIASRAKKGEFVKCFDHFNLLQTAIN